MAEFDRTNRTGERLSSNGPPGSRPADPDTGVRPEAKRGSGRLPWLVVGGIVAAAAVVSTMQRDPGDVMDATGNGPRTVQTSGGDVQAREDQGAPPAGTQDVRTGINGRTEGEPLEPDAAARTGLDRIYNEEVARFDSFVRSARFTSADEVGQALGLMGNALRNYDVGASGRTNNRGVAENLRTQADLFQRGQVKGGQEGTVLRNTLTQFSTTVRGVESMGDGDAARAAQAFTKAAEGVQANRPIAQQSDAVRRAFASASAFFRAMGSEGQ